MALGLSQLVSSFYCVTYLDLEVDENIYTALEDEATALLDYGTG